MANNDPRQVVRDHLIAPRKLVSQASAPHNGSGWRSAISHGGMGAKAETIRFLKERSLPGRKVLAGTFENQAGRMMNFTQYLMQNEQGEWEVRGGSGGGEGGSRLVREQPWVNLGGGGWPNDFYAGGHVIDNGSGVARIRLVAANGTILEDSVEDGIVLFLSEQPVDIPLQAELYDHHGKRVANHEVFDR